MPGSLRAEVHQARGLVWFVCLSVRMMCKWQEKVLALMGNSPSTNIQTTLKEPTIRNLWDWSSNRPANRSRYSIMESLLGPYSSSMHLVHFWYIFQNFKLHAFLYTFEGDSRGRNIEEKSKT